ncbi:unnamed protein product [Aphanomyces euteiches]
MKEPTPPSSEHKGKFKVTAKYIWALGIVVIISSQGGAWHAGMSAGTVGYGLVIFLVGTAYVALALSMSEMTSMLPFAGGVYGLSRCALGFQAGLLMGCCEVLEYTLLLAAMTIIFAQTLTVQKPELGSYQPLIWFVHILVTFILLALGGKIYWRFVLVVAILSILQVVVFVILAAPVDDYALNSGGAATAFLGDFKNWFAVLPFGLYLFTGTEGLSTLANEAHDPRHAIPRGHIASILTLFTTASSIYIVSRGLPLYMDISLDGQLFKMSKQVAIVWTTISSLACTSAVLLAASNIVESMSESRLFPCELHGRHAKLHTPIRAILCASLMEFIFCCVTFYYPPSAYPIFSFLSLASCMAGVLNPWLELLPFGIYGAIYSMTIYSMTIFLCCSISVVFVQNTDIWCFILSLTIFILLSIYYQCYAKSRQSFSEDERKLLLFVHIANNNDAKHRSPSSSTSYRILKRLSKYLKNASKGMSTMKGSSAASSAKVFVTNGKQSTKSSVRKLSNHRK